MNTLKQFVLMSVLASAMVACNSATDAKKENKNSQNPFFTEFTTLHQTYPFDEIKLEHFMPAFEEGMKQQMEEVNAIINNEEAKDADIIKLTFNKKKLVSIDVLDV